jgi:hypothetical protein
LVVPASAGPVEPDRVNAALPADEKAANIVIAKPAALAEAIEHTQALDNVITVNFVTSQPPPAFIPPVRPPLPAWRERLLRRTNPN